jgi:uncharacterized membrane protein YjgN (DUF898 family)
MPKPSDHVTVAALDIVPPAFTGSGQEYFRIWIVNLLLTLATLGVYSAWGKVRRLRYFDRNTMLAGATFDFGGGPGAILRGRALALLLLVAFDVAFVLSLRLALAVAAALLLVVPWLMRSALRYRARHTTYRGLPFGFRGSVAGAYRAYLPPVAAVLLPVTLCAAAPDNPLAALSLLPLLGWPAMHGAMLRYQHGHLTYGGHAARFEAPARRFFRPYLGALLVISAGVALCLAAELGLALLYAGKGWGSFEAAPAAVRWAWLALPVYLVLLLGGPFLQVRLANLVCSSISFPGMRLHCAMQARAYTRLLHATAVLTVLTLGLYRPFAAVRVYRYRLACMSLHVHDDFEAISAGARRMRLHPPGLELSW